VLAKESPEIPKELRRRYRGCWAGAKLWLNARRYKLYLPAITMGNLRSLASQMDELAALARCQSEYDENSVFCFTNKWLQKDIPDSNVSADGFQVVWEWV